MPLLDQDVSVVVVAVLAAAAVLFVVSAAIMWRVSARMSMGLHEVDIDGASAALIERIRALRGGLAQSGHAARSVAWALPHLDLEIERVEANLVRRRLAMDAARARLVTTRDVLVRIKQGWHALQRVIELGRVLGR